MKIININDNDYLPLPKDTKNSEVPWNNPKTKKPEKIDQSDNTAPTSRPENKR